MKFIRYANIVYDTTVDGPGLRNALYVSGCHNNCVGCHNPLLQDPEYGTSLTVDEIYEKMTKIDNDWTLSGGDPMEQASVLIDLVTRFKKEHPNKTVWIYSGYTYEYLRMASATDALLDLCDVLVDGKFEIDKRDLSLKFRGSSNQRIIDLKKSWSMNQVVLWEE